MVIQITGWPSSSEQNNWMSIQFWTDISDSRRPLELILSGQYSKTAEYQVYATSSYGDIWPSRITGWPSSSEQITGWASSSENNHVISQTLGGSWSSYSRVLEYSSVLQDCRIWSVSDQYLWISGFRGHPVNWMGIQLVENTKSNH